MPSNLLQADVGFPQFKEDQKPDEKITQVVNYLYMLLEQLRYSFGNLGSENFSESGIEELQTILTEPIYARLENDEGLINELSINATGLYNRLYDQTTGDIVQLAATAQGLMGRMSDAEGNITTLGATAAGLYADLHGQDGAFAQITANANAISTKVSSGDVSTMISQFANGLSIAVSNNSANTQSTVAITSNGVQVGSSGTINLSGLVKFTDLSTQGSTTINGSNITTGTVTATYIKLGGLMTVFQSASSDTPGGYLGYASGSFGTGGIGLSSADGASYVAAINASSVAGASGGGAKLHGGPSSDYTKYAQVYANGGGIGLRYHYSNASGDDQYLYFNTISGYGFSFHPGGNGSAHLGGPSNRFATVYCQSINLPAGGVIYRDGNPIL